MQDISFSVVIPTFNEAANIGAVIQALQELEPKGLLREILVVDNGSTDATVALARRAGGRVLENLTGRRKTIATLRNEGAAATCGNILAFLDGDMLVPKDWLAKAAAHFRRTGNRGALGFAETVPENSGWVAETWGKRDLYCRQEEIAVDFLPGRNLLICREVFDAVGGFDASLATNEDKELSYRVVRAGYRVVYLPTAVAIHLGCEKDLDEFIKKEFWRQSTTLRFARRWHFTPRTLRNPVMSLWHLLGLLGWVSCGLVGADLVSAGLFVAWLLPSAIIASRGRYLGAPAAYPWRLFLLTLIRWNVSGVALAWQLKEGEPFRNS